MGEGIWKSPRPPLCDSPRHLAQDIGISVYYLVPRFVVSVSRLIHTGLSVAVCFKHGKKKKVVIRMGMEGQCQDHLRAQLRDVPICYTSMCSFML